MTLAFTEIVPETPGAFGVALVGDIMVPLRDGVRLATDVYLPTRAGELVAGPHPVILERTPYGKRRASRSEIDRGMTTPRSRAEVAGFFVSRGYAVVFQDCRGRHGSEGHFEKYTAEAEDGYDTLAWIVAQPWCNGRVGTMGLSYAAHTQAALAALNPPGLAAMVLDSGGFSNAYQGGIRQGGAFELKQATWAYKEAQLSPEAAADPLLKAALAAEDIRDWFTRMPWRPGRSPLRWHPEYERYLLDQWAHGAFDDYWKRPGLCAAAHYDAFADVPTVILSSWYDAYVRTATENYVGLRSRKKGPYRLVMGPWLHGDRTLTHAGDVEFGDAAPIDGNVAPDWLSYRLAWFDRWLKGQGEGGDEQPAVRLFLMGGGSGRRTPDGRLDHGGRWISASDWPLPGTAFTPFYCHADGTLSTTAPEVEEASQAYVFDPAQPVPSIGGALTSGQPVFVGGGFDQREDERFFGCTTPGLPLSSRHDVLTFETEPLTQDVAVVGPIEVVLWVSSDAPDTDFTAKLVDVAPPSADYPRGFALNLTDGILRCRYRDSWEEPTPMEEGRVYRITIEPFATCNLFKAGHRIRLDISSSNFPKYDVNPNSYEPEGQAQAPRKALNRLWLDRARPSHVVLPVVAV